MTDEELARFALQLREAERLRAQIAMDEAGLVDGTNDLPAVERHSESAVVAAA
ncbi:MAG TPA: hypothetical protein VG127_03260 [Rubrobacteraceae bacterium]|jgi:hypothetical protein|nr:hypothetical protein [Rubrobacteraceae bacterium]